MNQFKGVEVGEHVTSFMEQTTDNPVGLAFVIWALVWIKPISIKKNGTIFAIHSLYCCCELWSQISPPYNSTEE